MADKWDELRDRVDSTDMSESIRQATRVDDGPALDDVMVSTSIRLPRPLMMRLRERAAEAGVPATTLMRQWVVDRLDADASEAVVSVADLERLIAERAHPVG